MRHQQASHPLLRVQLEFHKFESEEIRGMLYLRTMFADFHYAYDTDDRHIT